MRSPLRKMWTRCWKPPYATLNARFVILSPLLIVQPTKLNPLFHFSQKLRKEYASFLAAVSKVEQGKKSKKPKKSNKLLGTASRKKSNDNNPDRLSANLSSNQDVSPITPNKNKIASVIRHPAVPIMPVPPLFSSTMLTPPASGTQQIHRSLIGYHTARHSFAVPRQASARSDAP